LTDVHSGGARRISGKFAPPVSEGGLMAACIAPINHTHLGANSNELDEAAGAPGCFLLLAAC
jgi:hypothetical protein